MRGADVRVAVAAEGPRPVVVGEDEDHVRRPVGGGEPRGTAERENSAAARMTPRGERERFHGREPTAPAARGEGPSHSTSMSIAVLLRRRETGLLHRGSWPASTRILRARAAPFPLLRSTPRGPWGRVTCPPHSDVPGRPGVGRPPPRPLPSSSYFRANSRRVGEPRIRPRAVLLRPELDLDLVQGLAVERDRRPRTSAIGGPPEQAGRVRRHRGQGGLGDPSQGPHGGLRG